MTQAWRRRLTALIAWTLVAAAGAAWLARAHLQQLQADFETDARIAHRLLSQRVVQHDAVMATLVLLQPPAGQDAGNAATADALPRLPSVYPQILSVLQRPAGGHWPAALQTALDPAEAASRAAGRAHMAWPDLASGRYYLVMAGLPASYALHIDLQATVPTEEWPMDRTASPVRVTLVQGGQTFVVQAGKLPPAGASAPLGGWSLRAVKRLASPSQPLDLISERSVGWRELPWLDMLGWCLLSAALGAAGLALWRQRIARQRAEELLRLGQVARLNTLGELAAGMAHELNQPLTALLANTQAARRLLADEPVDLATAQTAMERAVEQARRAATVVGRLRRLVERPELSGQVQPLALPAAVQDVVHLLEPEMAQRGVTPSVKLPGDLPLVLAEPVALQQIIYNLLTNALQALEQVPPAERALELRLVLVEDGGQVRLCVRDHGPGIAADAREHLFEPFYTTRSGGLGLGLTLCESLAQSMGAQLTLAPAPPHPGRGAEFVLTLPLAPADASMPTPAPAASLSSSLP